MLTWLRRLIGGAATESAAAEAAETTTAATETAATGSAATAAAGTETSVDEAAVDETSVDETSVDETSVDETSVDETSVDETAATEAAATETPAPEAATGEAATDEAVADEAAAKAKAVPGVDVSSYQGTPGQWQGEAGNISWAAVKITELEPGGTRYVNPDAADDWKYLKQAGKVRIAYLFGHPSVDAAATVNFFVSELTALGLEDGDGISLDLEVNDGLGPAQVDAWAGQVLADLRQKLSRPPVVYTFISFAQEGNCAHLGGYPLWIADPARPPGQPEVPAPWRTWAIHQYSITSPIDRDVANYPTGAAMAAALGKPKEPTLENLGGSIVGDVTSARWSSGLTVVAGLGKDGFVQATRWDGSSWQPWRNISQTKAVGAPGLLAWDSGKGQLYYTDTAGNVQLMSTEDSGQTWT